VDVLKLLEYLMDIIESSTKLPLSGKVLISKKEAVDLIEQIINYLPDEFKKAQWVFEEKERILSEAMKESDIRRKETMDMLKRSVESHDITREARLKAEEIIASAQRDAKEMRLGAREYADILLSQLEKQIDVQGNQMVNKLRLDVEGFITNLEKDVASNTTILRDNIKELRINS